MLGTIGMTLLGMVLWQATEAPDISGQWTSDEWGTVVLEAQRVRGVRGDFHRLKNSPSRQDSRNSNREAWGLRTLRQHRLLTCISRTDNSSSKVMY